MREWRLDAMTEDGRAGAGEEAGASPEAGSSTGRERELRELRRRAQGVRAVTLYGPGGIGKSWLLRRLIADLAPGYPDGTFFVGLADLRQPDLLPSRVASVIGVSEEPGIPLPDTLAAALRSRRLLLALDDCGHLAQACAGLCERLLASATGLLVVAASREPRPVADGVAWPVPALALPPAGPASPGEAARYDAVRFFAGRAAAAAPGFTLSQANCAAAVGICRAVAGSPLAIELAAAWVRAIPAEQVAARLGGWLDRPEEGGQAGPAPVQMPDAAIDWSHDLLSPDEQVLLRRLSVFAGWSLEMAEQVCADAGLPPARILGLLTGLAEKSLIELEPEVPGQRRYRMPGAIRDYCAGRLARAGETTALGRRLRDYALSVGDYFLSIGLAQVPAPWAARTQLFRRYRADADNIRAALGWCLDQGDTEAGLRLCASFGACWLVLGAFAEGAKWFGAFLAADQSAVAAAVRGPALVAGAYLVDGQGDRTRAECWAGEGLAACRAAGNLLFTSAALTLLAQLALRAGRPGQALQYASESVEHARQGADPWSEGVALSSRAAAQAALGQLREARDSAAAALDRMLEIDQQWGAARAMLGLAGLERTVGNLDAARRHYLAALALLRQVREDPEIARCLAGLGRVILEQGDLPEARAYLAQALTLSQRTGSRSGVSRGLMAFAALAVREGRPDRAVQLAAAVATLDEAAPPGRARKYLDAAAGLGPAEVARLWAAGLQLTASAAAELALDPPR
jgi:predicted ATPase